MPTLFRLIVALVFIGCLAYGALFALTIYVKPTQKQITVRIPQRDLVLTPVIPKPVAPVTAAATLQQPDDPNAQVVDTPE
jgi:hypothetical protein